MELIQDRIQKFVTYPTLLEHELEEMHNLVMRQISKTQRLKSQRLRLKQHIEVLEYDVRRLALGYADARELIANMTYDLENNHYSRKLLKGENLRLESRISLLMQTVAGLERANATLHERLEVNAADDWD